MVDSIQHLTFSILKTYSVKELSSFKIHKIDGGIRIFGSSGEINLISETEKLSILQLMGEHRTLFGVFTQIQEEGQWGEKVKTIHAVVSYQENESLKDYASHIVLIRQRQEEDRRVEEEDRKKAELERQKEIEELRRQTLAELAKRNKERKEKAESIKLNNRIYMNQVLNGDIKPKSSSIIDMLLSPFEVKKHRQTHCFDCKKNLDSDMDIKCTNCGWLLCRCGACGCTYGLK
jgi:hypothetical protein